MNGNVMKIEYKKEKGKIYMYQKNPLLLKEMFFSDAEKSFDTSKLNHKKIEKLLKYPDLLNALEEWIFIAPDRNLLPKLKQLSEMIDKLYNFNYNTKIYRGFYLRNGYQNNMGLTNDFFLFKLLKKGVKPGYEFTYKVTNPISFSTDFNIAKAFGSVIIETKLPKHNKLVITNELSYILSKMRNFKKLNQTQEEVIILPDNTINCRVIKI